MEELTHPGHLHVEAQSSSQPVRSIIDPDLPVHGWPLWKPRRARICTATALLLMAIVFFGFGDSTVARSQVSRTKTAFSTAFLPSASQGLRPSSMHRRDFSMMAGGKKTTASKKIGSKKAASGTGFGAKPPKLETPSSSTGGFARDSFKYTGDMRPGKQTPMRRVPSEIGLPDYAKDGRPKGRGPLLGIQDKKTAADIEGMRAAGLVARQVLDAAGRAVAVGTTTDEIDRIVHEEAIARNSYPSPLNYQKFPKSCCTSVNEVICHGIPDNYKLQDGDIINIDITVYHNGFHGDCSEMFLVGNVDEAGKQLVKVTHDAWQTEIDYCKPGKPYKGIGPIIEDYVKQYGYESSPDFCGHGINKIFHTIPSIVHVRNNVGGTMEVGHTFTIEPMICEGTSKHVMWNDQWTAATKDGKRSAQFEHTLLVTEDGVDALTARLPNSNSFWWDNEAASKQ